MTSEGRELRPCPFCGDPASIGIATKEGHDGPEEWVRCGACGGRAPISAWNRRTEGEGLRETLNRMASKAAWMLDHGASNETADLCREVIALRSLLADTGDGDEAE